MYKQPVASLAHCSSSDAAMMAIDAVFINCRFKRPKNKQSGSIRSIKLNAHNLYDSLTNQANITKPRDFWYVALGLAGPILIWCSNHLHAALNCNIIPSK